MPDESEIAKAQKRFSVARWRDLFGESIKEPEQAERITVLMMCLRGLIMGSWSERRAAAHAVNNCIKACMPYVRTGALADKVEEQTCRK